MTFPICSLGWCRSALGYSWAIRLPRHMHIGSVRPTLIRMTRPANVGGAYKLKRWRCSLLSVLESKPPTSQDFPDRSARSWASRAALVAGGRGLRLTQTYGRSWSVGCGAS